MGTRSFPLLPSYALLIQAVRGYTLFPSPPLLCTIDPGCTWVHALSLPFPLMCYCMCMWVHALPLPSYVRQSMDCRKLVDVWQTPFKLHRDCQRPVDVQQTPYIIYGLRPRRRTVYVPLLLHAGCTWVVYCKHSSSVDKTIILKYIFISIFTTNLLIVKLFPYDTGY